MKPGVEILSDREHYESYMTSSKPYLESLSALKEIFLALGGK